MALLAAFAMAAPQTAQDYFQRGLAHFEQDTEKAEKEFKKAREADPGWAEPSFYLGLCAHARDDLKKAGRYYREALVKSPGHEQASYWLRALADSERLGKARGHRDRDQYSALADEVIAFLSQGGEIRSALFDLTRKMDRRFRGPGLFEPLFREFLKRDRLDLADGIVQYWENEAAAEEEFALQTLRGAVHLRRRTGRTSWTDLRRTSRSGPGTGIRPVEFRS